MLKLRNKEQVIKRLDACELEDKEGITRVEKVEETLLKFGSEVERHMKNPRLKYRKEDFQNLKKLMTGISEDSNEVHANLYVI